MGIELALLEQLSDGTDTLAKTLGVVETVDAEDDRSWVT